MYASTGGYMKYKVGGKVQVKSKEWIDAQLKDESKSIGDAATEVCLVESMFKYAGQKATIKQVIENFSFDGRKYSAYRLDIDDQHWNWTDTMLEDAHEEDSVQEDAR
jgi:hypothetical protein